MNEPNALWISDTTYLRTWQGFLYLAVVLDAYSRSGLEDGHYVRTELVLRLLEMALWNRLPGPGLIHYSDHSCHTPACNLDLSTPQVVERIA